LPFPNSSLQLTNIPVPGEVQSRVLHFLNSSPYQSATLGTGQVREADPFEALALEVFHHQYSANSAYRAWCEDFGASPRSVMRSSDIPAVPAAAFRELEFCCGTPAAEFRTSGTTGAGAGRHLLPDLEPYRVSALRHFAACVSPEGWKLRAFALAPPPRVRPFSSLSRMIAWVLEETGGPGSGWFVDEGGLRREKLAEALLDARSAGSQVLLLGTTAAFLSFYDFCDTEGIRLEMPGGSRVMDTGGPKGTATPETVPLEEFQSRFRRRTHAVLGIPPEMCVNEYGMTELCSQFYDRALLDHRTRAAPLGGPRTKVGPPWVRTTAVDPVTLAPLPPGQTGLLRHVDLANAGSVIAVLTEDLGSVGADGLVLEGRPRGAEARGCGLTFGGMGAER